MPKHVQARAAQDEQEERQAEQDGGEEPPGELAPVAPPGRLHPGLEHHAAGHQQDGERDRDGEVRDGDRERRPHRGLGVDGEVRPEERGEEHRLAADEHDDRPHPAVESRRLLLVAGVVEPEAIG